MWLSLVPAKAGTQHLAKAFALSIWIPAFAGMSGSRFQSCIGMCASATTCANFAVSALTSAANSCGVLPTGS
jgi:hypothetical protein